MIFAQGTVWVWLLLPMAKTADKIYKKEPLVKELERMICFFGNKYIEDEISGLYYDRDEFRNSGGMDKDDVVIPLFRLQKIQYNRGLRDYMKKAYGPCMARSKKLKGNEYNSLGEASGHKEEVLKAWPDISFVSFETGLENIERATEGDDISVKCSIHHGEANPEYYSVELFYMPDEKSYALTNLELENLKDGEPLNDKRPFR